MDRASAVAYLGPRYAKYLEAVGRSAVDTTGNLKEPIDDALLALGASSESLATWAVTDVDGEDAARAQLSYALLVQIVRDLGTTIDVSSEGDSIRLSQMRAAAEKDLEFSRKSLGFGIGTLDLDFLAPVWV